MSSETSITMKIKDMTEQNYFQDSGFRITDQIHKALEQIIPDNATIYHQLGYTCKINSSGNDTAKWGLQECFIFVGQKVIGSVCLILNEGCIENTTIIKKDKILSVEVTHFKNFIDENEKRQEEKYEIQIKADVDHELNVVFYNEQCSLVKSFLASLDCME